MKNSVLILGIALVSFSNICNAKNTVVLPYNLFQNNISLLDNEEVKNIGVAKFEKPSLVGDVEVFSPETVITYNPKTVKEIIAEGDKIVEYSVSDDLEFMVYEDSMQEIITQADLIVENKLTDKVYPLCVERTMYDEIAELELIIESKSTNVTKPLDFKKINKTPIMNSTFNTKKIIGMN
jgi:hypothetical protein